MKTPRITQLYLLALSLGTLQLQGVVSSWTGDDATNPTYFGDADNWTPGLLGHLGYGVFSDGSNGKTIQVVQAAGTNLPRAVSGFNFANEGWSLIDTLPTAGGSLITYSFNGTPAVIDAEPYGINSSGAGVNEISVAFTFGSTNVKDTGQPDRPVTVNAGNTLLFSGSFSNGSLFTLQGSGTMVVDNTNDQRATNGFTATVVMNDPTTLINRGSMQLSGNSEQLNAGIIGGDGVYAIRGSSNVQFTGTTLSPGGNGTTEGGSAIGTLTFQSALDTDDATVTLSSGTTVQVDIGNGGGTDNDKVVLDLFSQAASNGFLDIESGVTLNIVGSLIQDGAYTIFENTLTSAPIEGTFTTVNFNGVAINPSNFTLDYNADSIVVNVTGLIPEPSTYALIFGSLLGMVVMIKRRRS